MPLSLDKLPEPTKSQLADCERFCANPDRPPFEGCSTVLRSSHPSGRAARRAPAAGGPVFLDSFSPMPCYSDIDELGADQAAATVIAATLTVSSLVALVVLVACALWGA